ncbi:hypothetical protein SEA_ODAY_82 [Gordonia phage ODay]|nr:hypothetical protein SEA_ODAY_82 [Gordonia phage ODay]
MSVDPAIAAAQRAAGLRWTHLAFDAIDMRRAAREALLPLRELHRPVDSLGKTGEKVCATCRDLRGSLADWPTATDQLLYSSSELEGTSDAQ